MNANYSFQQGDSSYAWHLTGGAGPATFSAGHATWSTSDSSDYFYTVVELMTGAKSKSYRASMSITPTAGGVLDPVGSNIEQVQLYYRLVNYANDPGSPNGCSYPNGIVNPNEPRTEGSWILATGTPFAEYQPTSTTTVATSWATLSSQEALVFRIQIRASVHQPNGSRGSVFIYELRGDA